MSAEMKITLAFLQLEIQEFKEILKEVRPLLMDRSESIDVRWQMYLQIQPFLETTVICQEFDTLNEIRKVSWYDDFYLERGERWQLDADFLTICTDKFKLTAEQVDALKEEILEKASKRGYDSFENDW